MNYQLLYTTAIIGIILNVILSYYLPDILTYLPSELQNIYIEEISDMFNHHKRNLLTSSIIMAISVFVSSAIAENLKTIL